AVCHDCVAEMTQHIRAAIAAAPDDLATRVHAAIRAFRDWAKTHPAEFSVIFRSKGPGPVAFPGQQTEWVEDCDRSQSFAVVFLDLIVDLWQERPFPVPADEDLLRYVVDQLTMLRRLTRAELPDGA